MTFIHERIPLSFRIQVEKNEIITNDEISIMSKAFLNVHNARKSRITSTASSEAVRKMELSPWCHTRSLTKPVHVASQKPMKKSRCKMKRFSNFMISGACAVDCDD